MSRKAVIEALRKRYEEIRDERRMYANTATRIGDAFLSLLSFFEATTDVFLRKDGPDSTSFLISFLKGIAFNGKYGVSGQGEAVLKSVTSPDFKESGTLLDGKGFGLYTDVHGRSHAVADIIEARVKAVFAELEVKKFTFSSGDTGYTRAGSEIARVRVLDNGDFRCYFLADDGDTRITNDWHVGDQAMAKTSNIISRKTQMAENRYYWRLVVNTGEETLEDGKLYNFVDLSDTPGTLTLTVGGKGHTCVGYDTSAPNDEPKAGDSIVQLGSQTDPDRRYAYIVYVSTGQRVTYAGINDYDLDSHIVELRSAKKNFVVSDYYEVISASGTGESNPLVCYRGEWEEGAVSGHYDRWSHNNATWLCIVGKGKTTTSEPKDGSPEWVKETYGQKGDKGEPGGTGYRVEAFSSPGSGSYSDEQTDWKATYTIHVWYNEREITRELPSTRFVWSRVSEYTEGDTAWNERHAGTGNELSVTYDDLNGDTSFICRFLDRAGMKTINTTII